MKLQHRYLIRHLFKRSRNCMSGGYGHSGHRVYPSQSSTKWFCSLYIGTAHQELLLVSATYRKNSHAMASDSYTSRVLRCLFKGQCNSRFDAPVETRLTGPVVDKNGFASPYSPDHSASSTSCLPCRVLGSFVFTTASIYGFYTGIQAPPRSVDRRLGLCFGAFFGFVGTTVYASCFISCTLCLFSWRAAGVYRASKR